MGFRDTLRLLFSAIILFGMIGLCIYWRDQGGWIGLGAGALAFAWRYIEGGQRSGEERLGNGYVGLLLGLSIGFLAGAVGMYGYAHWNEWWMAASDQARGG